MLNSDYDNMVKECVASSRVRFARNVSGFPFPNMIKDSETGLKIIRMVNEAMEEAGGNFRLLKMQSLSEITKENLIEKHLISPALASSQIGGALLSPNESISIMINEEDHLREQCVLCGMQLTECLNRLRKIDDILSRKIDFAFHDKYGYLTACPTNVGTGMRASAMLFLPALTKLGIMDEVIESAQKIGITFRGFYGEGSKNYGYMYQISNQITLGADEENILECVIDVIIKTCKKEREAKSILLETEKLKVCDGVYRAYGLLTNAKLLSQTELIENLAEIKFGILLGEFFGLDLKSIDDIALKLSRAQMQIDMGEELSPIARDEERARQIKYYLRNLSEKEKC